ncbi:hypothetical protein NG895_05725 [Aeoliella sp. ICT_H6.2]|uniref:Porin n=1 Tax=Aeoliella straminimaris TaxID=2954799 RepID=A0A9X2F6W9_9BACT|nr:hypothetical protein [Aeoliella straminimaris]MCO6043400.1 hypothetical protein [Aeoliella straminimaris]
MDSSSLLRQLLTAGCLLAFATPVIAQSGEQADMVQVPREQLNEIQAELKYLRARDEQREAAQEAIVQKISTGGTWIANECSWGENVDCGSIGCGSMCGGSGCCGNCGNGGCGCGGLFDCYSCCCPTPEAPCVECPRVSTLNPYFNVSVFGTLTADMVFNGRRPVAPGTPYFLAPGPVLGRDQSTFDLHARQSSLGAAFVGPQWNGWQTGGQVLGVFYNSNVLADQYGFLPMLAFGEMKNDRWRFAAGLQFDVFNPGAPTVLPFSALCASGNSGNAFRGQLRAERYFNPSSDVQWTLQTALSNPVPTTIDPTFGISEDNGWPNVEGRIALALGTPGATAVRPFEVGFSGVVGQLRTTPITADPQVVSDVWGVGTDIRWRVNDTFGFVGEFYSGQGLGTYNGAILQTVNRETFESIRSTGGFLEGYVYLTPCVHSHMGYGIDDPRNNDVSLDPANLARVRNETYYANLLWDVNKTLRLGFELTYRETEYAALPGNQGTGYHGQFRWSF